MPTRNLARRCPECGHPIRVRIWPLLDDGVSPIAFYDAADLRKPEIERCPNCDLWLYNLTVANKLAGFDLRSIALLPGHDAPQS